MNEQKENENNNQIQENAVTRQWKELNKGLFYVFGAVISVCVNLVFYPLLLVKTRSQVEPHGLSGFASARAIVNKIITKEGLKGFYKGFSVTQVGVCLTEAMFFTAMEFSRQFIHDKLLANGISSKTADFSKNLIASSCGQIVSHFLMVPFDVISQRMQALGAGNREVSFKYHSGIDAVKQIIASSGIKGLFKGYGASLTVYLPEFALWWASYELFKREAYKFRKVHFNASGDSMPTISLCGAAAGLLTGIVITPLDVIKMQIQLQDKRNTGARDTWLRTAQRLAAQHGVRVFARGMLPRALYVCGVSAVLSVTYETTRRVSKVD